MNRHRADKLPWRRGLGLAAILSGAWLATAAADDPSAAASSPSSPAAAASPAAPFAPAAASAPSAAEVAARASLERIRALRAERPGDGLLVYYQAITHATLGERDAALAELRSLLGRHLGIVPAPGTGLDSLWNEPEFRAVRERLAAEEPRTADAPESFRLADPRLVPEGIAWDAARKRFLVGSVAQRKIVAIERRGKARDFSRPEDGLDTVLGLAVDGRRRLLYAVSTNGFEDSARTGRRNAVVIYDLGRGRRVARHDVPEALQLNDVAVAADGTLYATDSAAGSIYRMRPGEHRLTLFGSARAARGANGIAVAPDGAIYVTLSTGIGRVDPRSGILVRLPQPDSVTSGGIDGLYWHGGDLIGVQNSTNPGRVIRLRLADGGRRIEGLVVLQSHHHPAFVEPTTGAIADGAIHVLANTYVGSYRPDGRLRDADKLKPTIVLAVPLRR
ncbi:MAG: SMP-30/gluconolactonase/LRE family protein [Caldimonas sp.]